MMLGGSICQIRMDF
jgi:carbonyl reductase 1